MARSEERELVSRLAILIAHLLKWRYQPSMQSKGWKYSTNNQRMEIADIFEENSSLRHQIDVRLERAYERVVILAVQQTGLPEESFFKKRPSSCNEIMSESF